MHGNVLGPISDPHLLFERIATSSPEATAIVYRAERLSYRELSEWSGRIASGLQRRAVQPGDVVAVEARPSAMVAALLACLRLGCVYLPLDQALPDERRRFMIQDAAAQVVASDRAEAGDFDLDAAEARALSPIRELLPDDLAYVIYTSGSTGRPKGVAVSRASLAWAVAARLHRYGPVSSALQTFAYSFDASLNRTFWCLAQGGKLVLVDAEQRKDAELLGWLAAAEQTEAVCMVPGLYAAVLELGGHRLGSVQIADLAADVLPWQTVAAHRRLLPQARIANSYGPTETSITAVTGFCADNEPKDHPVPIGLPLPGVSAYILDSVGDPVDAGMEGELHIGGPGVARGYLGRPGLTAERFVPDPFEGDGARMYRTGDRCYRLVDGRLVFLGRIDRQVKLNGHRVELGEVEEALATTVSGPCAVDVRSLNGRRCLVAYLTEPVKELDDEIRQRLTHLLPEYMLPAYYVRLGTLPITASGKLDRRSMPDPDLPQIGPAYV